MHFDFRSSANVRLHLRSNGSNGELKTGQEYDKDMDVRKFQRFQLKIQSLNIREKRRLRGLDWQTKKPRTKIDWLLSSEALR